MSVRIDHFRRDEAGPLQGWGKGAVGGIEYRKAGVTDEQWQELLRIDERALLAEADDTEAFLDGFGDRLPEAVRRQLTALRERLEESAGISRKAVA